MEIIITNTKVEHYNCIISLFILKDFFNNAFIETIN
jgi:CTP:phosphocholine cytidylyltransferase-like protein